MDKIVDVAVIGSGAAGLTAAVAAARHGLSVIVVEKAEVIGGTTALSEGMVWIPCSPAARAAGIEDSADAAFSYLSAVAGNQLDATRARAYLEAGPELLDWLHRETEVRFDLVPASQDYESDAPGALRGGRALRPAPFDGRRLGSDFGRLKRPLPTTVALGGMMIPSARLMDFLSLHRSVRAASRCAPVVLRYALDRARGAGRGTLLSGGNALVGALLLSARNAKVDILTGATATSVTARDGRVTGLRLETGGAPATITTRFGVLIASGGFGADAALTGEHFPDRKAGYTHVGLAPATNTGDGLRIAAGAGAAIRTDLAQPCAWSPVSIVPLAGGGHAPFPHYIDRGKPGVICVDRSGHRFTNEARSYHLFTPDLVSRAGGVGWIVCDHAAFRRWGLGAVPPVPGMARRHLRSGYLARGATLADLASATGIDKTGLRETIARFNSGARRGEDPDFGRGGTAYERAAGDPSHGPNPSLGPLETPPYYAIRLFPGDIATFHGIAADADGRALSESGDNVPGLFVAGNDAASPFGGTYPGAGATIGPAMIFAWRAVAAMRRDRQAGQTDVAAGG
jgi:succinate dehydrogenase/fumarate reductase flavoprotein subunit